MTPGFRFRRAALQDLADIADHIAAASPRAAEAFTRSVEDSLRGLSRFPRMGSPRRFAHPAVERVRCWIPSGFPEVLVFYRALPGRIVVLRVLHGARDVERALEEE